MPSYSIPLSGLDANSQALSIISNNLSNINTVGYKTATANFSDLFYQRIGTSGTGDPMQQGTGTEIGSVSSQFTQGPTNADGVSSHVAIQGDGFFVLKKDGQQLFSRAGDFSLNDSGYLTSPDGAQVLGYNTVNGVVNTNAAPGALMLGPGRIVAAKASSNLNLTMNLDSGATTSTTPYSTPIQVYDSLGGAHTLTATFSKTAANTWNYSITIPQSDLSSGLATNVLASGTLNFNTDGTVSTSSPITLTSAALADGASTLGIKWNLTDASGNSLVTQTAGTSNVAANSQDGYASGSLQGYNVQGDGTIIGTFSNGQTGVIGQLALASFANNQGLSRTGSNEYTQTASSGSPNIGVPGSGGRGAVQGASVEGSNVDIAAQFALLIQAQRGYEANAKAITTVDQMTQDAFNMKAGL